jgi:hypothetical protein
VVVAVSPQSVFGGPEWNIDAVRDYFAARAESDEQYLAELKGKLSSRKAYGSIYDQTLASYYVHNYFRGRTFLFSREEFLDALAVLETAVVPIDDYFDKERFVTFRLNLIHSLFRAASLSK